MHFLSLNDWGTQIDSYHRQMVKCKLALSHLQHLSQEFNLRNNRRSPRFLSLKASFTCPSVSALLKILMLGRITYYWIKHGKYITNNTKMSHSSSLTRKICWLCFHSIKFYDGWNRHVRLLAEVEFFLTEVWPTVIKFR